MAGKNDKIKRQKIAEREKLDYEEKRHIAAKSDDRCCHCGKKVFFGYGATVEHFVPLSKGGTNRDINLIMLCDNCNQAKNNYIYSPWDYVNYLNEKDFEKLCNYFESYIKSFDFVNRGNLLACDRYLVNVVMVSPIMYNRHRNKKKRMEIMQKASLQHIVKRATPDDTDNLVEYFIKYLKKYDCLDSEEAARLNIMFWMHFGCIYFIEKDNDIKAFITVTVTESNNQVIVEGKNKDNTFIKKFLTINVFSYYSTDYSITLAYNLSREIPKYILREQELQQLPVRICAIKADSITPDICSGGVIYDEGRFLNSFLLLYDGSIDDVNNLPRVDKDKKLDEFFDKFSSVNSEKMEEWFKIHNHETIDWMLREICFRPEEDTEECKD